MSVILDSILEWLEAEKGCCIWRTHRRAKVVTPNRSKFWMVLECDSRSQEPRQIRVYDKHWADLKACELADPTIFECLANKLDLPPEPGRRGLMFWLGWCLVGVSLFVWACGARGFR